MATLMTTSQFANPDAAYVTLVRAHRDLSADQSAELNAALPTDAAITPDLVLLLGYREMYQGWLDGAVAYLAFADRHAEEAGDVVARARGLAALR